MGNYFDDPKYIQGGQPSKNYFDDPKYIQGAEQNPQSQQAAPQQQGIDPEKAAQMVGDTPQSFMDKVTQFNYAFDRMAQGTAQLFIDKFGSDSAKQNISNIIGNTEKDYQAAVNRNPSITAQAAGQLGKGTFEYALTGPAGLATSLGKQAATAFGVGFGDQYLDVAQPGDSRLVKGLTGGTMAAAFPLATAGALKIGNILDKIRGSEMVQRIVNPQASAAKTVAQNIQADLGDNAIPTLQGLQQTGTKGLTPGETIAKETGVTRGKEIKLEATPEQKLAVAEQFRSTQEPAKQNLLNLTNMTNADDYAISSAAKEQMNNEFVNAAGDVVSDPIQAALPDAIKNNPVLMRKYMEVKGSEYSGWKDLPNNSTAQLRAMKQAIDDELYKAEPNAQGIVEKTLSKDQKLALDEARGLLSNSDKTGLLNKSTTYEQSLPADTRIALQTKWDKILGRKQGAKAGQGGEQSLTEVFNTMFPKSSNMQTQLLDDISKAGGNVDNAKNVISLADKLRDSPLKRILQRFESGGDAAGNVQYSSNITKSVIDAVSNITTAKYKKALLDLTISGDKWVDDVLNVLEKPKGEQPLSFLKLIGKVANSLPARIAGTATAEDNINRTTD